MGCVSAEDSESERVEQGQSQRGEIGQLRVNVRSDSNVRVASVVSVCEDTEEATEPENENENDSVECESENEFTDEQDSITIEKAIKIIQQQREQSDGLIEQLLH